MLELKNVSKSYLEGNTKHSVLNNLDLHVFPKERSLYFLGKSGSGKSTLLNVISGIDIPDGGSVSIDGTDITKLSEKERTLSSQKQDRLHLSILQSNSDTYSKRKSTTSA